jgi:hypothetical protein
MDGHTSQQEDISFLIRENIEFGQAPCPPKSMLVNQGPIDLGYMHLSKEHPAEQFL